MKRNLKKITAILLTAIVLLALCSACGKTADDPVATPDSSATSGAPIATPPSSGGGSETTGTIGNEDTDPTQAPEGIVPGSIMNVVSSTDITNYTPLAALNIGGWTVCFNIYDSLFNPYQGNYADIRPGLAESYTVSDDYLVWDFKLREGVTFSNGTPFTSADVVRTLDFKKADNESDFAMIANYEATGDYGVRITLNYPVADFHVTISTMYFQIMSAQLLDQYGPYDNNAAVGTGPYYVESYTPGQVVVLKANENYWDKENMPHIETININIITDSNSAWISYLNGEIDLYQNLTYLQYMDVGQNEDYSVYTFQQTTVDTMYFNSTVAPFNDPAVRLAMEYLIDKEEANIAATDGTAKVSNSPWYSGSAIHLTDADYGVDLRSFNIETGLKILKDAGYEPSDISFEILAPTSSNIQMLLAENIQAQLMALGMDIKVSNYDRPTYMSYIREMNYQCAIHDTGSAVMDLGKLIGNALSSFGLNHFNNFSVGDPVLQAKLDENIKKAQSWSDYDEQNQMFKDITLEVYRNGGYMALTENVSWYVTPAGLVNMAYNQRQGAPFFQWAYWVA